MIINPPMLVLAREAEGLTQQDLEKLTGLSQSEISKAENGLRPLPEGHLAVVASALRVTPGLLAWQEKVYGFGSASFYHRKQQSLPQKSLRRIQGRVNLLRMRLARLADGLEIEPALSIPHLDLDDLGSPEEGARHIRALWRAQIGPLGDLVGYLEAAGAVVARRDFRTHRIEAISVWPPGSGPMTVVHRNLSPERQRFVLAHELGHLVHHEGQPPRPDAEREADRFAEELLMPAAEIRTELGGIDLRRALDLKPYWRVSAQSLILRALSLNLITPARCRSLHAYMNKLEYLGDREPLPLNREEPQLVREMLRVHVEEHRYTISELSQMLGMVDEDLMLEFDSGQSARPGLRVVR